jgi:hypothetical protein
MDWKRYELTVICILAAACIALAWAYERPAFIAAFAAQAAFAAVQAGRTE